MLTGNHLQRKLNWAVMGMLVAFSDHKAKKFFSRLTQRVLIK